MHRRPAPLTDKQTFETNVDVLEQFGLRRALSILTAICTVAIGAAAMTLAFEGFSTIPALCVVIALPTLGWGIRYARRKPITYAESLAWLIYCDIAIMVGVCVATSSGIAFVKLAWLVAVNAYACVIHGRSVLLIQTAVAAVGTLLAIIGSLLRADLAIPIVTILLVTITLAHVIAAWVVHVTREQITRYLASWEHVVHHDHLTGLLNRHGLEMACNSWPSPTADKVIVVATIDINNFKSVNDTHGHHVGDEVLRRTARRLQQIAGLDTLLARLGGDEFALVSIVYPPLHLGYPRLIEQALAPLPSDFPEATASMGGVHANLTDLVTHSGESLAKTVTKLLVQADAEMYMARRQAAKKAARVSH
ncbi:GGDEF domain-containing protein [Mycobacteroides chelonae]|uniref:GGDEF domain-containing protein n=1 Tax=Mycobacteroides chelonae TaxID=1774 RepID=UPI000994698E|nr:GGDEF domain-containing protein [Mycobacteroides chelonae]